MSKYSKGVYARLFPAANVDDEAVDPGFTRRPNDGVLDDLVYRAKKALEIDPLSDRTGIAGYPGGGGDAPIDEYAHANDGSSLETYSPTTDDEGSQSVIDYFTHNDPEARGEKPVLQTSTSDAKVDPNDPLLNNGTAAKKDGGALASDDKNAIALSPREIARQRLDTLINEKIVDRNHGIKSRIWEGIQNAIAGMDAINQRNPNATFGEVLGGGVGGVGGGIYDKTANEKRQHDRDVATAQRDYGTLAQADKIESDLATAKTKRQAGVLAAKKQNADIEHQRNTDALAGKKWTKLVSGNKIFKQNADGTTEPWIDPTTNKQGIDKTLVTAQVPGTNETVEVEPEQKLTNATNLAVGQAQRDQATNQFNASQGLEASKTNVRNLLDYNKIVFDRLTEMGKTNAEAQGALTASQGLYSQMQSAADSMGEIDAATDPKGYAAAKKTFDDLQEKLYQQVSKTQAGAALVQQMSSQGINRPATVTFNPIKAVTIKGGAVPKSKDPLGLFR